jgi:2-keto-3-deoxy-L-rhamnonate aldolase RhmA
VLAERVAHAFDFVWIDLEHSALSLRDVQALVIATQTAHSSVFVRLPRSDTELIDAILDTGVDGIVAPRIDSTEAANRLVEAHRYPPNGRRGFAPRRASRRQTSASPSGVSCVAQIESREALEEIDGIAAVVGVDALIVGTADLSFELGEPLDLESEALQAAIEAVGQAAGRTGKAWGVALGSLPTWATKLTESGASMLVFGSDLRLYSQAIEEAATRARVIGGMSSPGQVTYRYE